MNDIFIFDIPGYCKALIRHEIQCVSIFRQLREIQGGGVDGWEEEHKINVYCLNNISLTIHLYALCMDILLVYPILRQFKFWGTVQLF